MHVLSSACIFQYAYRCLGCRGWPTVLVPIQHSRCQRVMYPGDSKIANRSNVALTSKPGHAAFTSRSDLLCSGPHRLVFPRLFRASLPLRHDRRAARGRLCSRDRGGRSLRAGHRRQHTAAVDRRRWLDRDHPLRLVGGAPRRRGRDPAGVGLLADPAGQAGRGSRTVAERRSACCGSRCI